MSERSTQKLAEKIAELLHKEAAQPGLGEIQDRLEEFSERLTKIETKIDSTVDVDSTTSVASHPSLRKYKVIEAIVDEVFESSGDEKTCTFEPNGRSCDHCSMCSSHGF